MRGPGLGWREVVLCPGGGATAEEGPPPHGACGVCFGHAPMMPVRSAPCLLYRRNEKQRNGHNRGYDFPPSLAWCIVNLGRSATRPGREGA